jgi:hypothetical protein
MAQFHWASITYSYNQARITVFLKFANHAHSFTVTMLSTR